MNKFVYIKKDYTVGNITIKKNEIGILISKSGDNATVNFVSSNTNITLKKDLTIDFDPAKTILCVGLKQLLKV